MPALRWISSGGHQSDSVKRINTNPQTIHVFLGNRRAASPSHPQLLCLALDFFLSSSEMGPRLKACFVRRVSVHSLRPHSIQQLQVRNLRMAIYSTYRVITAESSGTNTKGSSENCPVYSPSETTPFLLCASPKNQTQKKTVCVKFTFDHNSNREGCNQPASLYCQNSPRKTHLGRKCCFDFTWLESVNLSNMKKTGPENRSFYWIWQELCWCTMFCSTHWNQVNSKCIFSFTLKKGK